MSDSSPAVRPASRLLLLLVTVALAVAGLAAPAAAASPTLSWVTPAEGSTLTGASATLTVQADPAAGASVTSVEFFVDGVRTATRTSDRGYGTSGGLYDSSWSLGGVSGSHVLKAVVTDSAGGTAEQAITVTVSHAGPTLTWVTPTDGSTITGASTALSVRADPASSSGASLRSVEFFVDGVRHATRTSDRGYGTAGGLYDSSWSLGGVSGSHTLRALVTDSNGKTAQQSITVTVAHAGPSVTWVTPTNGATLTGASTSLTVQADPAKGSGASLRSVEFFVDGVRTATRTSDRGYGTGGGLYDSSWSLGGVSGSHTLRALVTDSNGATAQQSITVTVSHAGPSVVWVTPTDGKALTGASTSLTVQADPAKGSGASLRSVEFFVDGVRTATRTSDRGYGTGGGLYDSSWSLAGVTGSHTLRSVVTDSNGATAQQSITVTVSHNGPAVSWVSPKTGTSLTGSSTTLTVQADPASGSGTSLRSVQFSVDGVRLAAPTYDRGYSTDGGLYDASWSISRANGSHTLTALVTDSNGLTAEASTSVTVANTGPVLTWTSPRPGAVLTSGEHQLRVDAQPDAATRASVKQVEFLVGGRSLATDTSDYYGGSTFQAPWPLRGQHGEHVLTARATDVNGLVTERTVEVEVRHAAPVVTRLTPATGTVVGSRVPVAVDVALDTAAGVTLQSVVLEVAGQPATPSEQRIGGGRWTGVLDLAGRHGEQVLTVAVTDSNGQTAREQSTLFVAGPTGITVSPGALVAGQSAVVTVTGTPGVDVDLLSYSRPSTTYGVIRRGTFDDAGTVRFSVTPTTGSRFYARPHGGPVSDAVAVSVRPVLTLTASASGGTYRFSGTTYPARNGVVVSLYRSAGSGQALVAQARTVNGGRFAITKRFTSSGRFAFVVKTPADTVSLAATSPARTVSVVKAPPPPKPRPKPKPKPVVLRGCATYEDFKRVQYDFSDPHLHGSSMASVRLILQSSGTRSSYSDYGDQVIEFRRYKACKPGALISVGFSNGYAYSKSYWD